MNWTIEDWAGNRMFPDRAFASFDDAWAFIMEHCDEDNWQDIYAIECEVTP